ncbi:MAG: flagellar filament capping protein FliD [Phycisphaeraceae bacterium]|nr:MAG: flagellar filament capping protein FliD [Phycisphaeraceae bacterium]
MSGVSSSVGVFSGIDSRSLIDQLLAVEARPKQVYQRRVVALQLQQTAFLDFNSRLDSIKRAARSFRENRVFQAASASSSAESVLTATARAGATAGTYQFIVDRMVSSQQWLSRGFADSNVSGIGASSFTFESEAARLDADVALSDLFGGEGLSRGRIVVTDSGSRSATIDLSRAGSVSEVLDLINNNGTAQVSARIVNDRLVVRDNAGGSLTIADGAGSTTATQLGIAGTAAGSKTGAALTRLSNNTLLSRLNDGNGVFVRQKSTPDDYDFTIDTVVGGQNVAVRVNLGDVYEIAPGATTATKVKSAVTTVGQALERINQALTAAGATTVSASIDPDGQRLRVIDSEGAPITITDFNNSGTAAALGIAGMELTGEIVGSRVLSGIATTLTTSLNGGSGVGGNGALSITARDGTAINLNIAGLETLSQIASAIESASGTVGGQSRLAVTLNEKGTGILVTDRSGGGGNLIITGTPGNDTAQALGISTGGAGVASSTVTGSDLERRYVSRATTLASLNQGRGIGTGQMRITDSSGATALLNLGSDARNIGDVIDKINGLGLKVRAEINSTGDGILVREDAPPGQEGGVKIKIEDVSGTVARSLNLAGESSGFGASNRVNGSFERSVSFLATDTLADIAAKINAAGVGVSAGVVRDGGGSAPFRLSLTATRSGSAGRTIIDTNGFDLGLDALQRGHDARVFFGSTDPARALLLSSSTNTLDDAIANVRIDLRSASDTPVTLTVSRNTAAIETAVEDVVKGFNELMTRVAATTSYDSTTKRAGPLLGDGTTNELRAALYRAVQSAPIGVTGRYQNLAQVGVSVGSGGQLSLDKDALRRALEEDPAAVESLLTARVETTQNQIDLGNGVTVNNPNATRTFSSLGVFAQLEELADRYVDPVRGVLTSKKSTIETQIKSQSDRAAAMDVRLAARRAVLEKQFLRMERAIGQLQSQQGSLSSIAAIKR